MDLTKYLPTVCEIDVSNNSVVNISLERLHYLESIEKSIPSLIEDALRDHKATTLKKLHEYDKLNPKAVNLRAKRYAEKNRDVINEKRRKKRLEDKITRDTSKCRESIPEVKKTHLRAKTKSSFRDIDISEGIVVRFDN